MTTNSNTKLDKKNLMGVFWRSWRQDAVWNFERQQNLGSAYTMSRLVGKLYKDDKEKRARALQRHLDFMAITPHLFTLLYGILAAMEEENANNSDFDEISISAVRASLMGPIASVGDSLIWGTLRIIAAGGSILGPILFLLIINLPSIPLRYVCLFKGYEMGTNFFKKIQDSGIMDTVTYVASIVGLIVIGCMIASLVSFEIPLMVGSGDFVQPLQSYLDQIMPALLPLGVFRVMYFLLGEKVKTTTILLGTIILSIVLSYFGIV